MHADVLDIAALNAHLLVKVDHGFKHQTGLSDHVHVDWHGEGDSTQRRRCVQSVCIWALLDDNHTLVLDHGFDITPDETSGMMIAMTVIHSAVIRDNVFVGAQKQVDEENHTAACMIPLWGRANTVTFINNSANNMRGTCQGKTPINESGAAVDLPTPNP